MRFAAKGVLALSAFTLLAAPVQAACWSPETYRAAQVRQLDTLLTIGAMRCLQSRGNFAAAYNRFIDANGETLRSAGEALRRHFSSQFGEREATGAYRSFIAAQTEAHLNDKAAPSCDQLAAAADAGTSATSLDELAHLAASSGLSPSEQSRMCRAGTPAVLVAARR